MPKLPVLLGEVTWKRSLKVLFFIATVTLAWFNLPVAVFAVGVAVLTAIYDKADSLIEISFGPLKAKLERSVSESEKLLSSLRALALAQSRALVAAASHTGRFATDDAWIFHAAKDIQAGLRAVGASDNELREAMATLVRLTLRDLGAAATNGSTLPTQLGDDACNEWNELRSTPNLSNPEFVEAWLRKHAAFGPDQREIIGAMKWIVEHQDVRDEAQFMLAKKEFSIGRHTSFAGE